MAIFKGIIAGPISGSIAGVTYSHNRGGQYTRVRATPTNPNTQQQQVVRSAMAQLSVHWLDTLTPAQRAGWDAYALNTPLLNKLGDPINVGGLGMYQRANVIQLQADPVNLARVDDFPTAFNLGGYSAPSLGAASEAAQTLSFEFNGNDAWVNDDDGGGFVQISRPNNVSINYFKGPYRLAGVLLGDSTTPLTSPQAIAAPFPFVAGQKLFVRFRTCKPDGRVSSPWLNQVITVA